MVNTILSIENVIKWFLDWAYWAEDLREYLHASHIWLRTYMFVHGEEMGILWFLAGIAHPCSE